MIPIPMLIMGFCRMFEVALYKSLISDVLFVLLIELALLKWAGNLFVKK